MKGQPFIKSLRLKNFLSYGEKSEAIELLPLNVLIGTNASGKSNILEALALLRSLPTNFQQVVEDGGGAAEWIWKGDSREGWAAEIEVVVNSEQKPALLSYKIGFTAQHQQIQITNELLTKKNQNGKQIVCLKRDHSKVIRSGGTSQDINLSFPALAMFRDYKQDPESTSLGEKFQQIRLYRDWNIGRHIITREPHSIELPGDFLSEDMSNLALIINNLLGSGTEPALRDKVDKFYEGIKRIQTKIDRGKVHISLYEEALSQPVPATRLSDGMLHYLCLLALLLHPEPPPLIAIEEPEIGMHPDMIRVIAELLIDASQRTQIIVTTHSDLLVSALDEHPECVLVCERTESGSELRRLKKKQLDEWLEKYSLGDLWLMGELGGVRR